MLSKSTFVRGFHCPIRIRHAVDRRASRTKDDEFLRMLAEGGFQFEKLVRHAWPGPEIRGDIHDPRAAHAETMARFRQVLENGGGVLHEATFVHAECLARVDMLRISRGCVDLCEIKAKSFDGPLAADAALQVVDGVPKIIGRAGVRSGWLRYISDIAFQTWVVVKAVGAEGLGAISVRPRLIVANSNSVAGEYESLGNFKLAAEGILEAGRATSADVCWVKPPPEGYRSPLIVEVDVSEPVRQLRGGDGKSKAARWGGKSLDEIAVDSAAIANGIQDVDPASERGWKCRDCEFRVKVKGDSGQPSGFDLCWGGQAIRTDQVLTLYRGGGYSPLPSSQAGPATQASADWVADAIEKLPEVHCIAAMPDDAGAGRQALARNMQISAERSGIVQRASDYSAEVRTCLMGKGVAGLLHFLDFETTTACLPLAVGMRPYEIVAFQFSCHSVPFDGTTIDPAKLRHTSFLNTADAPPASVLVDDRAFVDQLRVSLGSDKGPVFHWASHERTVLRMIRTRLAQSTATSADALDYSRVEWLDQLIGDGAEPGRLVDMLKVATDRIMAPGQCGRYSMKQLLPAICRNDDVWKLVCQSMGDGFAVTADLVDRDPYNLLPPMPGSIGEGFADDHEVEEEGIRCGTDAMRAFQQLRFGTVAKWRSIDRAELIAAMKRYCQLDTVAMVAVWKWMVDQAETDMH